MDKQAVFPAHLQGNLPHRLDEGLAFDIADGAADFGNDHVGIGLFGHAVDKFLDFIRNMGNHLHRGAQIFAPAFFVQHVPVHLAGGQVREFVQILVDEPLVMPQIQVGFRAVFRHVYLAVLVRAHGSRIHVDIRIQLLGRHF